MESKYGPLFAQILALVLAIAAFVIFIRVADIEPNSPLSNTPASQVSAGAGAEETEDSTPNETESATTSSPVETTSVKTAIPEKPSIQATESDSTQSSHTVARVQNPYSTPPVPFESIDQSARTALVNILCYPRSGSYLKPISGSGVMIDSRGVILTNAHVAQYVLLSEAENVNMKCEIRTGSPARARWGARVLYIPRVWVEKHASEILTPHPLGTGEHDYALLFVTHSVDDTPPPSSFPSLSPDTREAIAFVGDPVLVASYPAEFLGGIAAFRDLYAATSPSTIRQLLTYGVSSADMVSVGGVIGAQSGSSGGAVVNAWNRLVGIITTTSAGATTAERDLRAVSLAYINRDLIEQTGSDLEQMLSGNLQEKTYDFTVNEAIPLIALLLKYL